jgi:hypothetical protein
MQLLFFKVKNPYFSHSPPLDRSVHKRRVGRKNNSSFLSWWFGLCKILSNNPVVAASLCMAAPGQLVCVCHGLISLISLRKRGGWRLWFKFFLFFYFYFLWAGIKGAWVNGCMNMSREIGRPGSLYMYIYTTRVAVTWGMCRQPRAGSRPSLSGLLF